MARTLCARSRACAASRKERERIMNRFSDARAVAAAALAIGACARRAAGLAANLSEPADPSDRQLSRRAAPATLSAASSPTSLRSSSVNRWWWRTAPAPAAPSAPATSSMRAPDGYMLDGRPNARDRRQSVFHEGRRLRSAEGLAADRACRRRTAGAGRAGQFALLDRGAMGDCLARPSQALTFASAGVGTPGHIAGELLKLKLDEQARFTSPTKAPARR